MNTTIRIALYCLAAVILSATSYSQTFLESYQDLESQLKNISIDTANCFEVGDVFLERESLALNLTGGSIFVTKPINNRRIVIYIGKGEMNFHAPIAVEKAQIKRFFGTEQIEHTVKSFVLLSADILLETLKAEKKSQTLTAPINEAIDALTKSIKLQYIETIGYGDLLSEYFLNNVPSSLFASLVQTKEYKYPLVYTFEPENEFGEEISFYRVVEPTMGQLHTELVCRFPSFQRETSSVQKIDITKTTCTYKIDEKLHSSIVSTVEFTANETLYGWYKFDLFYDSQIHQVLLNNNRELTHELTSKLWVRFNDSIKAGSTHSLTVSYNGKYLTRYGNYIDLVTSIDWYPTYGYKEKSVFDLTFEYPKGYKLVSVGDKISEESKGDIIVSHWRTQQQIRNASFHIGSYSKKDYSIGDGGIPFQVLYNDSEQLSSVAEDLTNSYKMFSKVIGPIDIKSFTASEIPSAHGEAFPGLVHLSFTTFIDGENDGSQEAFVAHEMAHQWWGISVDFSSYRDRWLSEAFAEYSSQVYSQFALADKKLFFKRMSKSKQQLVELKQKMKNKNKDVAPISLGHRVTTHEGDGDYFTTVYLKGSWVLHMLRNLMLDLRTMKEDVYFETMKDFYTQYKGKSATTKDFQNVVEKNTGLDLQWFFNQWVDGVDIPKYEYAYKIDKNADGTPKFLLKIKQSNTQEDFSMIIPISINFGDGTSIRTRIVMKGTEQVMEIPVGSKTPKEFEFNIFQSVLCEQKEISWW